GARGLCRAETCGHGNEEERVPERANRHGKGILCQLACASIGAMKRTRAALLCLLAVAAPAAAQIPERLDRALTAIYGRNEYAPDAFGPAVWIDNGNRYVTIDQAGLTAHDTASGATTLLATAAELRPAGAVAAASFSSDASQVLLFTNTRKVWRL